MMTHTRHRLSFENILLVLMVLLTVSISFARLFFGVEMTDEALYVGDAYITLQGSVPLVDSWTQFTTVSLLTAPVLKLFLAVSGSTEGCMLYMRLILFVLKLGIVCLICWALRKQVSPKITLLSCLFLLPLDYLNLQNLSYTALSIYCLLIASALMTAACLDERAESRRRLLLSCLSGLFSAMSALAYPSQAITCAALAVLLFFYERHSFRSLRLTVCYTVAGLCAALATVLYLSVRGGGFSALLTGIRNVFSINPYWQIEDESIAAIVLEQIGGTAKIMLPWASIFLIALAGSLFILRSPRARQRQAIIAAGIVFLAFLYTLFRPAGRVRDLLPWLLLSVAAVLWLLLRTHKTPDSVPVLRFGLLLSFWLAYGLFVVYAFYRSYLLHETELPYGEGAIFMIATCAPPALLAPVFMLFLKKRRPWCKTLLATIWLPSVLWLLSVSFTAKDGFCTRFFALLGCVVCFLIYNACLLEDALPARPKSRYLLTVGAAFMTVIYSAAMLYGFVYRDGAIPTLNTRVTEGVYQGLYTTPERAQGIVELEHTLRDRLSKDDTVLYLDNNPYAYLMTDARHFTPCSWDFSCYDFGFNDDTWYQTYFAMKQDIPDKIIYIGNPASIDDENYVFTHFVHENYAMSFSDTTAAFPVRIYSQFP